ncbi:hypothetical protein EMCRGX_G015056 [Ephydatia muelleri]
MADFCACLKEEIPDLSDSVVQEILKHRIDRVTFIELTEDNLKEIAPLLGDRMKLKIEQKRLLSKSYYRFISGVDEHADSSDRDSLSYVPLESESGVFNEACCTSSVFFEASVASASANMAKRLSDHGSESAELESKGVSSKKLQAETERRKEKTVSPSPVCSQNRMGESSDYSNYVFKIHY